MKIRIQEFYNSDGTLVKRNEYGYIALNKENDYVKAITGRLLYLSCNDGRSTIFEAAAYKNYTYPYLISQEKETIFSLNGLNPIVKTKNYFYENLVHKQPTRIETINSRGLTQRVIYRYPQEMVNSGQTVPYQEMINRNIIEPVIEQEFYLNGVKRNKTSTGFALDAATNLILPNLVQTQYKNETPETKASFLRSDDRGNPLSVLESGKYKTSYVYSYSKRYLIAKISNADYTTVENLLGGSTAINTFANSNPTEAQVNTFLATLRASSLLANSKIVTYTYAPLTGVKSTTTETGIKTFYDYDPFQRLINIKNKDGNIIKHVDYHNAVKPAPTVFVNESQSGIFYGPVFIGSIKTGNISFPVIYTVPEGKYASTISQADANQKAIDDINLNGQNYADQNGTGML